MRNFTQNLVAATIFGLTFKLYILFECIGPEISDRKDITREMLV